MVIEKKNKSLYQPVVTYNLSIKLLISGTYDLMYVIDIYLFTYFSSFPSIMSSTSEAFSNDTELDRTWGPNPLSTNLFRSSFVKVLLAMPGYFL